VGGFPYSAGLADAVADALALDGSGRLIDVGCGPGTIALRLAHFFDEAVGVDPDAGMLVEAEREAAAAGVTNARWVKMRAEELPGDLGTFRIATFSRSFHWIERDRVAAIILHMLEPGGRGAFMQVGEKDGAAEVSAVTLRHPAPLSDAIDQLVRRYLGPDRRAGRGIRNSSPDGEWLVLERAGFQRAQIVHLDGGAASSTSGAFAECLPDTELRIWRTPLANDRVQRPSLEYPLAYDSRRGSRRSGSAGAAARTTQREGIGGADGAARRSIPRCVRRSTAAAAGC
jgi:ubiquinone/menaquinone biosynthesis C-methylase UbiE